MMIITGANRISKLKLLLTVFAVEESRRSSLTWAMLQRLEGQHYSSLSMFYLGPAVLH